MTGNNKHGDKNAALKWIFSVAKPTLPFLAFVVVLNGIAASLGTVTALVSKELIDSAVAGLTGGLVKFCAVYVAVTVFQILLNVLLRYLSEKCRAKLDIAYKKRLFSSQLKKQYGCIRAYHSGELINRLTGDVGVITDAVTNILPSVAGIAVRLVCAFAVLVYLQWQFAVVFAVGGIMVYTVTRFMRGKIKSLHKDVQKAEGRARSFWQETMENLLVVKSFCAEQKSEQKSDELMELHYKARMKKASLGALSSGASHAIIRTGYLFALIWCAFKLLTGEMSFGSLTAITALVGQVQQPFMSLSGIVPKYYSALSSAERIMEIENLPDEKKPHENTVGDVKEVYEKFRGINIENVCFAYDKNSPENVLSNLDLYINKGDFVSITGSSGIGKSTLFKLMLDIYEPQDGKIEFEFTDNSVGVCPEMRKLFAYVPQGNMLLSGTIRENLLFGDEKATDEQLWDALATAQAKEIVEGKPGGLDSTVEQNGRNFSGGQRQRLTVARALVKQPKILVLDDSSSALDYATDAALRRALRARRGSTTFIVSQRIACVRDSDMILVLDNGRLVGRGTHEQLLEGCEVYRDIYCSQFPEERESIKRRAACNSITDKDISDIDTNGEGVQA